MRHKDYNTRFTLRFRAGFTLIELLIIVAIIAVLVAILLPVLGRARTLAKRIACQSNLRQIALAWHAYFDDNDGSFYQGVDHNYDFGGWKGIGTGALYRPLNKYLGLPVEMNMEDGAEVFRCPADEGGEHNPVETYLRFGNSYQTNIMLIGPDQVPAQDWVTEPWRTINREINKDLLDLKLQQVSGHSRLLLVGDRYWLTQWDPLWTLSCGKAWHGKHHHYNLAFLDGHVAYIKIYKGLYVTQKYCVQPFRKLDGLASQLQETVPCSCGRE